MQCLVLRENGSFEYYSNYNMVSRSDPGEICERIERSDDSFLLMLKEGDLSVIKKVDYSWGNLISNSVASTVQSYDCR
jgi:hypothetical protein